jgi:hypothetical protein
MESRLMIARGNMWQLEGSNMSIRGGVREICVECEICDGIFCILIIMVITGIINSK